MAAWGAFGATARPNNINFYPITLKLGHKPLVDVVWRRVWPAKPYDEFEGPLTKRLAMYDRNGGKVAVAPLNGRCPSTAIAPEHGRGPGTRRSLHRSDHPGIVCRDH